MGEIDEMAKDPIGLAGTGQVQQKPLVTIDVPPYGHFLIRCQNDERRYDIDFLHGKLQEVIHTEKVKV